MHFAVVTVDYTMRDDELNEAATWQTQFRFDPYGYIHVNNEFSRDPDLPVMPRIGMNVELPRELDNVEWFGRGPFENYWDRKLAANVGRYSNKVSDHYVPYMRPQENGYKTDTRWVALHDGADTGLLVLAQDLISMSWVSLMYYKMKSICFYLCLFAHPAISLVLFSKLEDFRSQWQDIGSSKSWR